MSHPPKDARTDEELLAIATTDPDTEAGREAASALLGRYRDRVYQWCYRYGQDHERALDLAQEVLLRAYRRLHTFEQRARFSSWLFMVARTTCLNAVTRPRLETDPEFEIESLHDRGPGPDAEVMADAELEEMRLLMQAVLDPQEHEAMMLRYFEALPPDEITRLLGLQGRAGARGLLQRARRKLQRAVDARRERGDGT